MRIDTPPPGQDQDLEGHPQCKLGELGRDVNDQCSLCISEGRTWPVQLQRYLIVK